MLRNENLIEDVKGDLDHLIAIRHDLHTHPEIGLEEVRTSAIVARELESLGYKVHRGLAKTGIVGTLKVGAGTKTWAGRLKSPSSGKAGSTKACVAAMPCFSSIMTSISALTNGPV